MVFFTCSACGESVKKVQVGKHVAACRGCECLSCIDCGQDFWGDDYKQHVRCISEEQKYGGKGYEGKAHKGDLKQQAWLQRINELMKRPDVSPKVRGLLEQIGGFDNVPRKKAKFQNWMKNSLRVHSESVLERVWDIFSEASSDGTVDQKGQERRPPGEGAAPGADSSARGPGAGPEQPAGAMKNKRERKEERQKNRKKEKKELRLENHQENSKSQKPKKRKLGPEAGGEEAPAAPAGKKGRRKKGQALPGEAEAGAGAGAEEREAQPGPGKRKLKHLEATAAAGSKKKKAKLPGPAEDGEPENHEAPARGKFNWKGTIKAVLRRTPDNEIAIKKLRKKVLAQYYALSSEQHRSEEALVAIFNRKLSRNPDLRVLKEKVRLLK